MNRAQELAQRQLRFQQPLLFPVIPLAVFLMSICYFPWLAAALALALNVALNSRRWTRLRFIAIVVVFAFAYNAVCCLEVAIISSLDLPRYMLCKCILLFWHSFLVSGSSLSSSSKPGNGCRMDRILATEPGPMNRNFREPLGESFRAIRSNYRHEPAHALKVEEILSSSG